MKKSNVFKQQAGIGNSIEIQFGILFLFINSNKKIKVYANVQSVDYLI